MTSEAREIAARLTKAQREAFERSNPTNMHPDWHGRISTYGDTELARQLYALGLVEKPETFAFATNLGLAVRAELERQEQPK